MATNAKNLAELLNTDTTIAVSDVADGSITTAKLADGGVTTAKIADSAVTSAKSLNLGRRNLIINGAMQIWQRGTSTTTLTANDSTGYNGADRFGQFFDINDGSGTISLAISQSTDTPASETFDYSIKAVVTDTSFTPAGTDNVAPFTYKVETFDANPLGWGTSAAKPATLSYWIKSSVAGTGTLQIRLTDSSAVSSAADGNFYTTFVINAADTWEKKTHLIPANTTDGWRRTTSATALHIHWNFGSNQGNVATEDAWFRAANHMQPHSSQTLNFLNGGGTAYLTGVQLEVGSSATDFEHRLYGEELRNCQRYFVGAFDTAGSISGTKYVFGQNFGANSNHVMYQVEWPVQMRSSPQIGIGSSGVGKGTASASYAGPNGMSLYYTNAGTSNVWHADVTADAEL